MPRSLVGGRNAAKGRGSEKCQCRHADMVIADMVIADMAIADMVIFEIFDLQS